jgi:hypothetical protein
MYQKIQFNFVKSFDFQNKFPFLAAQSKIFFVLNMIIIFYVNHFY